jgi:hypothetical protein
LRAATGCAADCGACSAKPNDDSAQQQPVKKIPPADPDKLLRNSLRVGMFKGKLFDEFEFRLLTQMRLLIHLTSAQANEDITSHLRFLNNG